jgi:hypothetical protein
MDTVRELDDAALDCACGGSTILHFLGPIFAAKAGSANADASAAADRQRQLNDRMAQARSQQSKIFDIINGS